MSSTTAFGIEVCFGKLELVAVQDPVPSSLPIQSVCLSDWTPIFDALLEGVVADAGLPCAFGIPEPEEGFVINPREVNVYITPPGGEPELIFNVDNWEDCSDEGGGWYYDDPSDPTAVYICPSLCGEGIDGTINVAFGCDTIKQ